LPDDKNNPRFYEAPEWGPCRCLCSAERVFHSSFLYSVCSSGCYACKIAIKNITDAINEANCDITLNIRNTNLDDILRKEITKFPTTVITKVDNDYKRKELARLEGSFPSDYIKDIINKLEKE